jgi:hypothetical protein
MHHTSKQSLDTWFTTDFLLRAYTRVHLLLSHGVSLWMGTGVRLRTGCHERHSFRFCCVFSNTYHVVLKFAAANVSSGKACNGQWFAPASPEIKYLEPRIAAGTLHRTRSLSPAVRNRPQVQRVQTISHFLFLRFPQRFTPVASDGRGILGLTM